MAATAENASPFDINALSVPLCNLLEDLSKEIDISLQTSTGEKVCFAQKMHEQRKLHAENHDDSESYFNSRSSS
jgi:hypothetical protein